jgi:hypothetical protein
MIMDYVNIIQKMNAAGVCFSSGLTHDTIAKIEKLYEIRFPDSLRMFYQTALPIFAKDAEFPRWDDFSPDNVAAIRRRMEAPYEWLKRDIERGFWLPAWDGKTVEELLETAPKLIPIYSHRYGHLALCLMSQRILGAINKKDVGNLCKVTKDIFLSKSSFFFGKSMLQYC